MTHYSTPRNPARNPDPPAVIGDPSRGELELVPASAVRPKPLSPETRMRLLEIRIRRNRRLRRGRR